MKVFYYAILAISCSIAYFSSEIGFNEPTLLYFIAVAVGSVSPIIETKPFNRVNENPIIIWLYKLNEYAIYPVFQFLSRSSSPYRKGYLLNVISLAIIGIIWFIIFKLLQFIIPTKYDPALCGWMVFIGGCITTIFFCGTRDGAWPFFPVIKRKYSGRIENTYPTGTFYVFVSSGFILYGSTIFHALSYEFVQIAIIFVCIGYLIFAGTFYPQRGRIKAKTSFSSVVSILFHLGGVLCFILAFLLLFQEIISPISGFISQFPTINSIISILLTSTSQFPLSSFILSIHSQFQSYLSFIGLSGIWWSIVLMIDLGVIFFFIEKKISSYSNYGFLYTRGFSIMASVSVIISIVAIVASCIIMSISYLPKDVTDRNQDSLHLELEEDYSGIQIEDKRLYQDDQIQVPNRGTSVINSGRVESLLASMTNHQRSQVGIPELNYDGGLAGLAKSRSENMAGRKTVDHQGIPKGVAENCAMNFASGSDDTVAQAIMSQWIGSSGHRGNILNQMYTRFGVGVTVSGDNVYAVQNFQF